MQFHGSWASNLTLHSEHLSKVAGIGNPWAGVLCDSPSTDRLMTPHHTTPSYERAREYGAHTDTHWRFHLMLPHNELS